MNKPFEVCLLPVLPPSTEALTKVDRITEKVGGKHRIEVCGCTVLSS